jgi:hypothetical protein
MNSYNDDDFTIHGGCKPLTEPLDQIKQLMKFTRGNKQKIKVRKEEVTVNGVFMRLITFKPAKHQCDDILYNRNKILRDIFPRGCSFICLPNGDIIRAFGTRKFVGYESIHDDEKQDLVLSGKMDINDNEFIPLSGRKIADTKKIYYTEKSNGENCKCGGFYYDSVFYLWAGSKMTIKVWKADEPVDTCELTEESHADYPNDTICTLWSKFYLSLNEQRRDYLQGLLNSLTVTSFVGEINRPWGEHIVPITHLFIEFFTLLDVDGISIPPEETFSMFRKFGLRVKDEDNIPEYGFYHVPFTCYDVDDFSEMSSIIENISDEKINDSNQPYVKTEGGVLYFVDGIENVLALTKYKNDWYFFWRRVREQCKGKHTTLESIETAIRKLMFLDSYQKNIEKWVICAKMFFTFYKEQSDDDKKYIIRSKYATAVKDFIDGNIENFKIPTKENYQKLLEESFEEKTKIVSEINDLKEKKRMLNGEEAGEVGKAISKCKNCLKKIIGKIKNLSNRISFM